MYNSATGTWSTAQLSVARRLLVATTVGNLAIVAGGHTGSTLVHQCPGLLCFECQSVQPYCGAVISFPLSIALCDPLQSGTHVALPIL